MPDPVRTPHRRLSPLDQPLLATLEEQDARLYQIVHAAMRVRATLREALHRLRVGDDPAVVRAGLERWATTLRELRRLAGGLR